MENVIKRSKHEEIKVVNHDIGEQTKNFLKLKSFKISIIKPLSKKKVS